MSIHINNIGNQRISYKTSESIQFEGLDKYLLLAKKTVSKFSKQFYSGLATKIFKDEDALSSVAYAIMMADWRWDDSYKNEAGTKKTKYSYRNQCALWAMKTYISKDHKKKSLSADQPQVYSLDHILDESDLYSCTQDKSCISPVEVAIKKEEEDNLKNLINLMLSSKYLTDRQRSYIKLYYLESYTFDSIGKIYGITREAVRQGLQKAISELRSIV